MKTMPPKHPGDVAAGIEHIRLALLASISKRRLAAADIHRIRVNCKRLRAALRLLRHQGSLRHWRRHDHALRDLARDFSAAREWQVLHDTLQYLADASSARADKNACRHLLAHLPQRRPRAPHLPLLIPAIDQVFVVDEADTSLANALLDTATRCRRLAKPVIAGTARIEQLHKLRKWVKYLGYQLSLAKEPDAAGNRLHKKLVTLGRLLGVIHDLAALEHYLQHRLQPQGDLDGKSVAAVDGLARRQRKRLTAQAVRQTSTLFTGPRTLA